MGVEDVPIAFGEEISEMYIATHEDSGEYKIWRRSHTLNRHYGAWVARLNGSWTFAQDFIRWLEARDEAAG